MAVERGYIKLPLYNGDYEPYFMTFYGENGIETDIATTYDEIVLEIRSRRSEKGALIKRLTLTGGGLEIIDTNKLQFDLSVEAPEGVYFWDMRFRLTGSQNWLTLLSGTAPLTSNVSRIDNS